MTVATLVQPLSNLQLGHRRPQEKNRNEGRKYGISLHTEQALLFAMTKKNILFPKGSS